jgi:hypothetical protein
MRPRLLPVLAALLLLAACDDGGTGPVYFVDAELYDWVKAPEAIDQSSDQSPIVADPIITFHLAPGDSRSTLRTGKEWRVGRKYLFGFDVRLERKSLGNERVALSHLFRKGDPATEIVSVLLDADRGVTVMGRTCVAPTDLGNWHRVEMRIHLSNKDTGFLEVFCDRKPIWARINIRTTFPPVCRLSEGCDTDVPKPVRYEWQLGLLSNGGVSKQIMAQMQRLHYRRIFYIPHRVGTL